MASDPLSASAGAAVAAALASRVASAVVVQPSARGWTPTLGQSESVRFVEMIRHVQEQRRAVAELASGAATLQRALVAHEDATTGRASSPVSNAVALLSREELTESSSGESDNDDDSVSSTAFADPAGLSTSLRRHATLRWRLQWLALRTQELHQRIERASRAFERRASAWTPSCPSHRDDTDEGDDAAARTTPQPRVPATQRPRIIMRRPRAQTNYKSMQPSAFPRHAVLSLPEETRYALTEQPLARKRSRDASSGSAPARPTAPETPLKIKLFRSKSLSSAADPPSPPAGDPAKRGRALSGSAQPSSPTSPRDVKRRRSSSYDIDNLIIPENMIQPNMRIATIEYKDIDIPQWRVRESSGQAAAFSAATKAVEEHATIEVADKHSEEEVTDDEAYLARHRPLELLEAQGRRFDVLARPLHTQSSSVDGPIMAGSAPSVRRRPSGGPRVARAHSPAVPTGACDADTAGNSLAADGG